MNANIFVVAVLICCIINLINSLPVQDNGRNKHPSYEEIGTLNIEMVSPDGTQRILKPSEVLSLKSQLLPNSKKFILYKLIDGKGFSHYLTDHQIERLLNFDVIAIVSRHESDIFKQLGFGHLLVILEKDGTIKLFIYKLTLKQAITELPPNYPYHFATSKHAYHTTFQD